MEAGHCEFKYASKVCTARETTVGNQIINSTQTDEIGEKSI